MTRTLRLLALAALLAGSRASAATALFSTLLPDGSETLTTLPLASGAAAGPAFDVVKDPAIWLGTAHPRFSPDGTRILFRGGDLAGTKPTFDRLLVVPAAGGTPLDITPGAPVAALLSGPSWSTDGTRALVVGDVQDGAGTYLGDEVFSVPAAGGAARQLTTDRDGGSKYFPVMSPDGRWVAYVWERPALSTYALAVVPAAGGRPRVLDSDVVKASAPSWSRDSRYVAYARWNGPDAAASTYTDLFRVDARSGARRNLTAGRFQGTPQASWQGSVMNPTFSPDGARIAFAYVAGPRPGDRGELYVIGVDGGTATQLSGTTPVAMNSIDMGFGWDGPSRVVFPYVDSDAADPNNPVWPWNEGLASVGVLAPGAVTLPLYGPLFPGHVADVTVR